MKKAKRYNLIECAGAPYEIGRQWGEGCKESILKASEICFNGMMFAYKASKEDVIVRAMRLFPLVQEFDPYLVEIMQGQAAGAGISFEEIFAQKCTFELGFYYSSMSAMCTSFAATGKATAGGQTLLGQTIDWFPGTPIDLIKVHHANGPVQLVVSIASTMEYTLSSVGFGICANATIGKNYAFNMPLGGYIPRVMRQKNIDDAMDLLKQAARGLGYYHLADSRGRMLGIESVSNNFTIINPEKDVLVHSNHYLTEGYKKGDMASELIPDSFSRLERIRSLVDRHYGSITPETAMEIMADHDNYPHSICSHVDPNSPYPSETLASFIMVPAEGVIYATCGNPCECEYSRYEL